MHDCSRSKLYESVTTSKINCLSITFPSIIYCVEILQKLRARLVPHLKYEFLHPDRVIIREQNLPLYVYFVISGEIEVKKSVYDRVSSQYRCHWTLVCY